MPEPDCFFRYYYCIPQVLQCGILLRRENPTYMYWLPVAAARCGFKKVLFIASRGNTFVGGTCALPSALLELWQCNMIQSPFHNVKFWPVEFDMNM